MADIKMYSQVDLNGRVSNASPQMLIKMLYEGALQNMSRAVMFMQQKDPSSEQQMMLDQALAKAVDIISALQESLNTNLDTDLPHNLDMLYDYIQRQLLHARVQKDVNVVVECQSLVETLKSGWDEITQELGASTA